MTRQINLTENEIRVTIRSLLAAPFTFDHLYEAKAYTSAIEKLRNIRKPIKVSSRKAKGRNLQKWAVGKIAELLNYKLPENKDESHIRSREMGQAGVDVVLSKKAKLLFPFAVECKNQEKINIPEFLKQAKSNETENTHLLLIVKNKTLKEPIIIMEWDTFSALYKQDMILKATVLD